MFWIVLSNLNPSYPNKNQLLYVGWHKVKFLLLHHIAFVMMILPTILFHQRKFLQSLLFLPLFLTVTTYLLKLLRVFTVNQTHYCHGMSMALISTNNDLLLSILVLSNCFFSYASIMKLFIVTIFSNLIHLCFRLCCPLFWSYDPRIRNPKSFLWSCICADWDLTWCRESRDFGSTLVNAVLEGFPDSPHDPYRRWIWLWLLEVPSLYPDFTFESHSCPSKTYDTLRSQPDTPSCALIRLDLHRTFGSHEWFRNGSPG